MPRDDIGVDWGDQPPGVCVREEAGRVGWARLVAQTPTAMSEWGWRLEEWRAAGLTRGAAIEHPEGRLVEFLLDHGVVVYPVNPKARDRARDLSACIAQAGRFRLRAATRDRVEARGVAEFLRTDHPPLAPLAPSSAEAQERNVLTRDQARLVRPQTRRLKQIPITLKEDYPRAGEGVGDWTTQVARDFLQASPTPAARAALRAGPWRRCARAPRLSEARTTELGRR